MAGAGEARVADRARASARRGPGAGERRFRLLDEQMRVLERERQKLSAIVNHTDSGFLVFDASLQVMPAVSSGSCWVSLRHTSGTRIIP